MQYVSLVIHTIHRDTALRNTNLGFTMATATRKASAAPDTCDSTNPCPLAPVLALFGSRWKHQILWHLQGGAIRFNELTRRLPGITPRTLTRQLRDLERDGLIVRTQYSEIPPRVEYSATDLATSLASVFRALNRWGSANLDAVEEARARYDSRA